MSYQNISIFWISLRQSNGTGAKMLAFTILTACRTNEVLSANWNEIDEENSVWIIPAHRMKVPKEHRVPLTQTALKILKSQRKFRLDHLIFPSQKKDKPLSNNTMASVLKRMNQPYTPHGFRSTFRTWVAEQTDHSEEVAKAALAHTIRDKVDAAYQRGDLFEKRRLLMQDWSEFVCGDTYG